MSMAMLRWRGKWRGKCGPVHLFRHTLDFRNDALQLRGVGQLQMQWRTSERGAAFVDVFTRRRWISSSGTRVEGDVISSAHRQLVNAQRKSLVALQVCSHSNAADDSLRGSFRSGFLLVSSSFSDATARHRCGCRGRRAAAGDDRAP